MEAVRLAGGRGHQLADGYEGEQSLRRNEAQIPAGGFQVKVGAPVGGDTERGCTLVLRNISHMYQFKGRRRYRDVVGANLFLKITNQVVAYEWWYKLSFAY